MTRAFIILSLLLGGGCEASAAVALASPFTDHGVLQRDLPIPVWGTETPGTTVTVTFRSATVSALTGSDGWWRASLPPQTAGGPDVLTVRGTSTVAVKDLLVGEVWLCAGQSNMAFSLSEAANGAAEVAAADHPRLRLFPVQRNRTTTPQTTNGGKWQVCTPATAKGFSAVAIHFARELQRELDVPIGVMDASYGNTEAECWTSQAALESSPEFRAAFPAWDRLVAEYPAKMAEYNATVLPAWEAAVAAAKAAGKPVPKQPRQPLGPKDLQRRPAGLYNGMIAPLAPYALRGVAWYQGENNTVPDRAEAYRRLLPLLIADWRRTFARDLSFHIVQLANCGRDNPADLAKPWPVVPWAVVREGQALTAATVPGCGLAVTIDIGDPANIHPLNKLDVGRRLARSALARDYHRDLVPGGPVATGLTIDGRTAVVAFTQAEGLAASGGALTGFTIAGEDGRFVPAEGRIDGRTVRLSNPAIAAPVAVRYLWGNSPTGNLTNATGLPAVPFRFPLR